MKNFLWVFACALLAVTLRSTDIRGEDVPEPAAEPVTESAPQPPAKTEAFRPVDQIYVRTQVNELERKISQLEQEIRFLEEQIRNIDRRVDDLQRHI